MLRCMVSYMIWLSVSRDAVLRNNCVHEAAASSLPNNLLFFILLYFYFSILFLFFSYLSSTNIARRLVILNAS